MLCATCGTCIRYEKLDVDFGTCADPALSGRDNVIDTDSPACEGYGAVG